MEGAFHGAKAALFLGDDLLVYQRDSDVIWPDHWDFPGGGREGDESPFACLRREVQEEFALDLVPSDIRYEVHLPAIKDPTSVAVFFVACLPASRASDIRFGDEGQRWALMAPELVAQLPNLVPGLRERLMLWLRKDGRAPI